MSLRNVALTLALLTPAVLTGETQAAFTVTNPGLGYAYGLNASGQVVGQNGAGHAFLYSGGVSTDLGTLGGAHSFALNINDSGHVVGWAGTGGSATSAFLYADGVMTNLTPGSVSGGAQGINASGQVVGWYADGTSGNHPFLYSGGTMTSLGTFASGSDTHPLGINASGQVVGYTSRPGISGQQPFLIENGTTTILPMAGAFQSINASGQAVGGRYFSDTVWHAIAHSNGTTTDLGTLGGSNSWAYGINGAGQTVGSARTGSGAEHAFLYSNGVMTDLNSLIDPNAGLTLTTAVAINDRGQIVGWGTNASGQTEAFLLTPPTAAVPGPSGISLLAMAGVSLGWYFGWRRGRSLKE